MQKKLNQQSEDAKEDEVEEQSLLVEDEALSQKIIDRIVTKKRLQQSIFDDFSNLQLRFQKIQETASKCMK